MKRALVLCPGRGSYTRDCLGSLSGLRAPAIDVFDGLRAALGRPTITDLDSADRFRSALHIAGENASLLTAAVSLTDLSQVDREKVRVVGACGNSMGWYTALGFGGALSLHDCGRLIETLGSFQAGGVVGGQIVTPVVDADSWRRDPAASGAVAAAVEALPDRPPSDHLGGQAVLGGTDAALAQAVAQIPQRRFGPRTFPLRLPLHSAFHTPLMADVSARAQRELGSLGWRGPEIPLIDGRGHVWRPLHADPAAIAEYTLGHQITAAFDFTAMVRTAVGELAPDIIVLPGPGSNLGGAIAQVLISLGWQGLRCKDDFLARQREDPFVVAMRWPDQRRLVV